MTSQEIQEDIAELQAFFEKSTRPKVRDLLAVQIRKWQTELIKAREDCSVPTADVNTQSQPTAAVTPSVKASSCATKSIVKDLRNYAWDQSDKFMKVYIDIQGVHKVPADNIQVTYSSNSVKLIASDVGNFTYRVHIAPLFKTIDTSECKFKIKADRVLIMLKKNKEGETWAYLKEREGTKKSVPKLDEKKDPNEGLMDMLKQMYEDGDDEMKRTLAKAWSESQQKKMAGEDGMPDMPSF